MHAGVAPIPVRSGSTGGRVRMNKSGNRQLKAALHHVAVAQLHDSARDAAATTTAWPGFRSS